MRRWVGVGVLVALVAALFSSIDVGASGLLVPSLCFSFSNVTSHGCTQADDSADPVASTQTTYYQSNNHTAGEYLIFDMGGAVTIDAFRLWEGCLYPATGIGGGCTSAALRLAYGPDGISWTDYNTCLFDARCGGGTTGGSSASGDFCDSDNNTCTGGGCHMGQASPTVPKCTITATTARYWRLTTENTTSFGWIVYEWQLFGVASPPSVLSVSPTFASIVQGHSFLWSFTSTDATGNVVSGAPFSLVSTVPAGGLTSCSAAGGGLACTASGAYGAYQATWADSLGHTKQSAVYIHSAAASFAVAPSRCGTTVVGSCSYRGIGTDATGTVIPDAWGFGTLPAHVSCVMSRDPATGDQVAVCRADAAGTYTIPFSDAQLLTATADLVVGATVNQQACGATDPACWIGNLIGAVQDLVGGIVGGVTAALFVSQSGPSYLDFSGLDLVPVIGCRGGEAPTSPDGVHCLAFPFSVPVQLLQIVGVISVSPTAPSFTLSLPCGYLVQCTHTVDPSVVLTPTVMGWVRGVEYVLFVASLGLAVRKYVQAFGVA